MEKLERKHVAIRPEKRPNGKTYFVVHWTPAPNDRQRRTFVRENEAEEEADRVEMMLEARQESLSKIPASRMKLINSALDMLPQDDGATLLKALQFYVEKNKIDETPLATVREVGEAFIQSRSHNFSVRQQQTVRSHIGQFIEKFGTRDYTAIDTPDYTHYLAKVVGGAGKSQNNHLITLKSMARWARDIGLGKRKFLPPGPTPVEQVQRAKVKHTEHQVYQAEQFMRLLVFAPEEMVMFLVLGQFAGIRAAERVRMYWSLWRRDEDNKLVLTPDITKTKQRRRVDVMENLGEWLAPFAAGPDELMVPCNPHKMTVKLAADAKVPWIDNALRAGYASYHLELFDNAALTAKNDGHSVTELETDYKSISGITKKSAKEMFSITPGKVLAFAQEKNLPQPAWATRIKA